MALYIGSEKVRFIINNKVHQLNVGMPNKNKLLSADGFTLKDKNGIYLMPKATK